MPRLIFTVSEEERELWVERAYDERTSLSEWLRRAANERAARSGLTAGEQRAEPEPDSRSQARPRGASSPAGRTPAPAVSSLPEPRTDEMIVSSGIVPMPPAASVPEKKKGRARSAQGAALCEHRVPAGAYCRKCDEAQ